MNELEVDALDRDLDLLARSGPSPAITSAPDRPAMLALLAELRAADWPDRTAGERIAGAVAAQLDARSARDAGPAATADWWSRMTADRDSGGRGRRPPRGHRRLTARRSVALVSAAAAVLAGLITAAAIHGGQTAPSIPPAPAQVYHSRFAAAVLPRQPLSAGPGRVLAGGWQLLSYVTTPGWHANDIGTPPLTLSCPSTTVCYMIAARPVPVSGWGYQTTPRFNLLEVSRDGGGSWTTLSLPPDVSITTPLQCPESVTACYAAGYDAGRVVLLATADGGLSWSARPIPGSVTDAATLTCTSNGSCVGLFEASGWAPGYDRQAPQAKVLVTRDGGLTWSAGPPTPRGQLPDYLACAGPTCVLLDQLITLDNSQSVNGTGPLTVAPGSWTAWYSDDGGATWQRGRHPAGLWTMASHDLPESGTISCSDRLHCWAAMSTQQVGQPGLATAFAATSDGGASWVTQPLPADRAQQFILQGMSCPAATQCYAAGGDSSGPVILTTRDGGTVWSAVKLPRTSAGTTQNGSTVASMGPISCAAAGHCVAAPENTDSAHRVPIYVLRSRAALP